MQAMEAMLLERLGCLVQGICLSYLEEGLTLTKVNGKTIFNVLCTLMIISISTIQICQCRYSLAIGSTTVDGSQDNVLRLRH